jgi:hypothetical protein
VGVRVHTGFTLHVGYWMAYCTCPGCLWWCWRIWWNEEWQGKPKYSKKTCPSATLFTTNPTWPDPGSNPGRRGGKPATNRLRVFLLARTDMRCWRDGRSSTEATRRQQIERCRNINQGLSAVCGWHSKWYVTLVTFTCNTVCYGCLANISHWV